MKTFSQTDRREMLFNEQSAFLNGTNLHTCFVIDTMLTSYRKFLIILKKIAKKLPLSYTELSVF